MKQFGYYIDLTHTNNVQHNRSRIHFYLRQAKKARGRPKTCKLSDEANRQRKIEIAKQYSNTSSMHGYRKEYG